MKRRVYLFGIALILMLVSIAGAQSQIASRVKPSKKVLARAIQFTESTAGRYLTIDKDDGMVFITTHHCCSAQGCTGPVPSNTTCVGGFLLKCEHTIEVNGEDVPIPPLCSPAP